MKLVRVDLEDHSSELVDLDHIAQDGVLGGRCLGVGLMARNAAVTDPLDPKSPLVVSVGSLSGTGFPMGNRLTFTFRSPLTGTIAWALTGGYAAADLASLGYLALYITGRSEELCYLMVTPEGIGFVGAEQFRGLGAAETCRALKGALGDVRVLSIGPAGERQAPVATVINDSGRSSGVRHGAGAVLGSKNLKAIVIKSKRRFTRSPAQPLKFAKLLRALRAKVEGSSLLDLQRGRLAVHGTAIAVEALGRHDAVPVKNYTRTTLPQYELVGGTRLSSTVLVRRLTCSSCQVSCRRETIGQGLRGEGPDYAQISALGTNCVLLDLEKIAFLTQLCYDVGVDPIEAGNTLAVYAELSEKGLTEERLNWGDWKRMAELIVSMSSEAGVGRVLAMGAHRTAELYGDVDAAPTVKGITVQNTDPRAEPAWGLINAVESYGGAAHIWVYPTLIRSFGDLGIETVYSDLPDYDVLAARVHAKRVEVAWLDSLGVCAFSRIALDGRDYAEGYSALYGVEVEDQFLMEAGQRVLALERQLNRSYGIGEEADWLPKRFVEEPLPDGKHKGSVCPIGELLSRYRATFKDVSVSGLLAALPRI
ncbi:MAG: hypothetical protein NZ957_02925 [Thaumarchaeota archaeon]|nr:hypothetical protein [Candidatus Calditenuaceae archaeon]MDW8042223.1 aldehyde ferredoxin oxidoreductase C-terminal domain-containing protein [Nitrososphaerota archaeon]